MKPGSDFKPENLMPINIPRVWKAMEKVYDSGKARVIGVSNFSTKKLADLLEVARIPPTVNQVECHPSWQQTKLREFCKSKNVHLSVSSFLKHLYSLCTLWSSFHLIFSQFQLLIWLLWTIVHRDEFICSMIFVVGIYWLIICLHT